MASVDIRQLVVGFLTLSMFIMLGNMIKKDYFDPPSVDDVVAANGGYKAVSNPGLTNVLSPNSGPWKDNVETLKPCWNKPAERSSDQSKGYIIFSLTGGPHLHFLQVTNAVLIARQIRATIVLPVIIGDKAGEKREFGEVYDVHKFIRSLNGVVKIAHRQPPELATEKLPIASVPNIVTEDYVMSRIEPLFKRYGNLKLATRFTTSNMTKVEGMKYMNSVSCTVVFEALQLQAAFQELVNSVLQKLNTLSHGSDGRFIAVDWRAEMFGMKRCQGSRANGSENCFSAEEIGQFLHKIGFEQNTTIYLTQNGWDYRLDELTKIYPNTYTKESLIPSDKVAKYSEFSNVIDFYVCSHSDVFVPMFSRLFCRCCRTTYSTGQNTNSGSSSVRFL